MMSELRGCGAMATIVSLCFPHPITSTRRMTDSEIRRMTDTTCLQNIKAGATLRKSRSGVKVIGNLQALLQSAGIASQLNIADARDRPFFTKALHLDTAFPVGDLSAGTRDQLLITDGWHQLDDQSQGRRADSPAAGIARAAL